MNIVLFDIYISGHHSEYINHIVNYIVEKKTNDSYYFVVHPNFTTKFEDIVLKSEKTNSIHWQPVTEEEIQSLSNLSMIKKSFVEYRLVEKYAKRLKSSLVYLLYFNDFQLALAFHKPKFKIRGIIFQQFSRMSKNTWKEKLKYYRKYYTTKFFLKNSQIVGLFVLNDTKTASYFNSEFRTDIFKVLPDPIPKLEPLANFNIFQKYSIKPEKQIFLHFGSLAVRKGTFEVIDAARFIPEQLQNKTVILIVGRGDSVITSEKIKSCINSVRQSSKVEIIWVDDFVSSPLMKSIFMQCKAVLMPYKNAEASSGILGHAIASSKPVIATGEGLLKELVEQNNFGILIPKISPENIAKAMIAVKSSIENNLHYEEYIEEHTSEKFAKILIG